MVYVIEKTFHTLKKKNTVEYRTGHALRTMRILNVRIRTGCTLQRMRILPNKVFAGSQ